MELELVASGGSLEIREGCKASKSMLPASDHDSLMDEELSILGPDAVFESVLIE